MLTPFDALHGLALRKFGSAEQVASLLGADAAAVTTLLGESATQGMAMAAKGNFMCTPKGQQWLAAEYPARFADQRADAAMLAAVEQFETVNRELKQAITDWQTLTVAGTTVPNDHSDAEHDTRVLDRLARIDERAERILRTLAQGLPRFARYAERLGHALELADNGETQYVSGAKIDSYHTVWFELHEDLIRVLGRTRDE
jgi:hypothetical protein